MSGWKIPQIAVRLEGGIGDCILGCRFIPAIEEKHPGCVISAYIDSEGQTFQKDALQLLYPSMFSKVNIIPRKKYRNFSIEWQGMKDEFKGAIENVPEDILLEMQSHDYFYDLHIDSLKFTRYDFNWLKYFYSFPSPEIIPPYSTENYFLLHLASDSSGVHQMEQWYIVVLTKLLAQKAKCKIIVTEKTREYLSCLEGIENVEFVFGDLETIAKTIANAKCFICIDSGLRYIAYGLGTPVLCFSVNAIDAHRVLPSHKLRWLIYEDHCFPLHYNAHLISRMATGILENKGASIIPGAMEMFDRIAVYRKEYKVSKDAILNEN